MGLGESFQTVLMTMGRKLPQVAHWDKFRLVLTDLQRDHETPNTWNESTFEKQYNYLLGNIKKAMRLSIPYMAIQNTPRKPKFWNNELSAQRKELRQAQRAWRNDIGNHRISVVYMYDMYLCSMLENEIETPKESVERDHSLSAYHIIYAYRLLTWRKSFKELKIAPIVKKVKVKETNS